MNKTTALLLLLLFSISAKGEFKKSQCKVDADCAPYGDNLKCGPRNYKCGKKCEAIQMVCYLPPKPKTPKKPKVEENLNLYKPVE